MASRWSQATLLRRLEIEFAALYGASMFDAQTGIPSIEAEGVTVAELASLISREVVREAMTGRKSQASKPVDKPVDKPANKPASKPAKSDDEQA